MSSTEIKPKYICNMCNFSCNRLLHYDTHLSTNKHKKNLKQNGNINYLTNIVYQQNEKINNLTNRIDSLEKIIRKINISNT